MATDTKNPVEKVKEVANSEPVKTLGKQTKPFQQFITKFNNDAAMTFAATIAYNLMVAMLPILIALIAILGFTLGNLSHDAQMNVQNQIVNIFPTSSRTVAAQIVNSASDQLRKSAGILAIFAFLSALFGGSRLFVVMEQFFDLIYHLRPRTFLRQNLIAIGMLLVFLVVTPIMVLASSAPALILTFTKYIPFLGSNPTVSLVLGTLLGIFFGVVAGFILFVLIYIIVPNQKVSFRHSWLGALVASVALELFLFAFPFYTTYFLKGYAGAVGGAIILLLFFYYFAVILLLGAEINAFFSEKVQPLPNDFVTFFSTAAGRVNKDRPDLESSHMDAKPTDRAINAHIADIRRDEKQTRNTNSQKQQQVVAKAQTKEQSRGRKEHVKTRKVGVQGPSSALTILEILAGTALTVVIELLRLRNHGK